jgi:hypothetical protein
MQWGVKSKLILCNIDRVEILNKKLWHTSKKENKLIATLKKSEKDCQPKMEAKTILLWHRVKITTFSYLVKYQGPGVIFWKMQLSNFEVYKIENSTLKIPPEKSKLFYGTPVGNMQEAKSNFLDSCSSLLEI